MSTKYTEEFKATMDELLFTIVTEYLENEIPFRLIITSEDVWDKPLPSHVINNGSNGLMSLDITDQSLEDSYYDHEDDLIWLTTGFDGLAYTRPLDSYDVVGLVDLESKVPVMFKPFVSERPKDEEEVTSGKQTIDSILATYEPQELTDSVILSLSTLKHYNPQFFEEDDKE